MVKNGQEKIKPFSFAEGMIICLETNRINSAYESNSKKKKKTFHKSNNKDKVPWIKLIRNTQKLNDEIFKALIKNRKWSEYMERCFMVLDDITKMSIFLQTNLQIQHNLN